jgi:hypothetical protein
MRRMFVDEKKEELGSCFIDLKKAAVTVKESRGMPCRALSFLFSGFSRVVLRPAQAF